MAFDVRFYTNFAKRKNSTKLPSGTYDEFGCILKAPSSIIAPTIEISYAPLAAEGYPQTGNPTLGDNEKLANYTYAYIPNFGRYYFIKDIRYCNRVWEIDLEVDVLATYKAEITGSTKYVLRSQTQQDISLVDDVRLKRHHVSTAMRTATCNWITINGNVSRYGCYVVGVVGVGGETGTVTHYVMDANKIVDFLNQVFNIENYDVNVTDSEILTPQLVKAFMNPSQYIVSIMWFPLLPPSTAAGEEIVLGWWRTHIVAPRISDPVAQYQNVQINGTTHPQSGGDKSHYLNSAPYTTRSLFLPCFGEIPVDTERGSNLQFQIACMVDYITGEAQVDVRSAGNDSTETAAMIARVNGQVGVPLPVAQTIQNGGGMLSALSARMQGDVGAAGGIMQAVGGIGSTIGGLAQGSAGTAGAGIGGLGAGITNAGSSLISASMAQLQGIAANIPTCHSAGAFGSFIESKKKQDSLDSSIILSETFVKVSEAAPAEAGLPLAQNKALSSLTGYVLLANGTINMKGSKSEKDAVEAYLTTGFYIE